MAPIPIPILDRIKSRTIFDKDTNCYLYQGKKDKNGYGRIKDEQRKVQSVHRLSAKYFLGLDMNNPKELALHKPICSNKNCWNPEHLYVGNQYQNQHDRIDRNN